MKIGVWVYENQLKELEGGAFGYTEEMKVLFRAVSDLDHEIFFIGKEKKMDSLNYICVKELIQRNRILNFWRILKKVLNLKNNTHADLNIEISKLVDVIYYSKPKVVFHDIPYIFTLWDVGHLASYGFPELVQTRFFNSRQQNLFNSCNQALMVVCESNVGKKEAMRHLNLSDNKIELLSLLPSKVVDDEVVASEPDFFKLNKVGKFIFYPARFWPHKNHANLIYAFENYLKTENADVSLVLTGGDGGNLSYINSLVFELNITRKVHYLGIVKFDELKWLYLNSAGLIFPSLMGPTNMPLIEAKLLNCPIACSNLLGHKEQLSEVQPFYFDALNVMEIFNGIKYLFDKDECVFPRSYNQFSITEYRNRTKLELKQIFEKTNVLRRTWGRNF